jgi:iron-sulfur cluster assembly protein
MIEVTAEAVEKLKSILVEEEAGDSALRVVVVPAGQGVQYMLTLEKEASEDDIVTETEGLRLLIDSENADLMDGVQIDYIDDLMRSGFVITNPNMPMGGCACGGQCGCGGH